uniref:Trichohyalin-like n=1 Tax=Caenorhabditis tropicalis TaxID=1561998 RepID=A0A1I7TPF2_9PELO
MSYDSECPEIKHLERINRDLCERHVKDFDKIQELKELIEEKEQFCDDYENELESLKEEQAEVVKELNEEIEKMKVTVKEQIELINGKQKACNDYQRELETVKKERDLIVKKTNDEIKELKKKAEVNQADRLENQRSADLISNLQKRAGEQAAEVLKLQKSLKDKDEKVHTLESQLLNMEIAMTDGDEEIQELNEKLKEKEKKIGQLAFSNKEKDEKIKKLEEENAELQDKFKEAERGRLIEKKEVENLRLKIETERFQVETWEAVGEKIYGPKTTVAEPKAPITKGGNPVASKVEAQKPSESKEGMDVMIGGIKCHFPDPKLAREYMTLIGINQDGSRREDTNESPATRTKEAQKDKMATGLPNSQVQTQKPSEASQKSSKVPETSKKEDTKTVEAPKSAQAPKQETTKTSPSLFPMVYNVNVDNYAPYPTMFGQRDDHPSDPSRQAGLFPKTTNNQRPAQKGPMDFYSKDMINGKYQSPF